MKSECLNIRGLNVWYKKDKPVIKDTNLLVPNLRNSGKNSKKAL